MQSLIVKDLCKTYIVNKRQNNVLRNVNMEIKEDVDAIFASPERLKRYRNVLSINEVS